MPHAVIPKTQRTRELLLAALQELLLDPAVTTVSVPQVVGRAGMSQGTFYNYFDSLADAMDAVGVLLLGEHARTLAMATAGADDMAEVFARSARQTISLSGHRPDVGRLFFDAGLPVDCFAGGLRAHLNHDLLMGLDTGAFVVADSQATLSVVAGGILGTCLDIHRGRLALDAVPGVVTQLLIVLGVSPHKARRLVSTPQPLVPWPALPLRGITV